MNDKNTVFYKKALLNCRGKILDLSTPKVMGILNTTPDSFFDGGKYTVLDGALARAEQMVAEGASIIDIGGVSTKPGANEVTESDELQRLIPVVETVAKRFSEVVVSVDTFRAKVAYEAVAVGAGMVNDIGAGELDGDMFETVAQLKVPYIMMHMQGTPATMQQNPVYDDVTQEVLDFLIARLNILKSLMLNDVIVDPGFGFGKTVEHNFALLRQLDRFNILGVPVLVGLSRKSMICKVLKKNPDQALNGTTALHSLALLKGADILRVHDVKEAMEVVKLMQAYAN